MKFESREHLFNKLQDEQFLTSDDFNLPDIEYVFILDGSDKIYQMFAGDWFVLFDFEKYKNFTFRKVERKYNNENF